MMLESLPEENCQITTGKPCRRRSTTMNSLAAASDYPSAMPAFQREATVPSREQAGIRLNGHIAIYTLATVLALATASECRGITYLPSLRYGAVLWLWWGVIASALWRLGRRVPLVSSFSAKTISLHLLLASFLGIAHLLLLGSLGFTDQAWRVSTGSTTALSVWTSMLNINRFGMEILLYGFVFGIAGVVQFQIRAQRDAMKALELQKQLSSAQLRALQMQLEPHFLFNTLNAITTLVELGRQKEAAEMLSHLNVILKSTLKRTTPEKVPLSEELEFMENYLAIEQIRFADRLRIEIKVDPTALDGLVPCFLLQPIVENAIRHGIAHCETEGRVEASARRDGNSLHLRIRDSGHGLTGDSQNGHGIGLTNTRERLAHFYQTEYAMRAQPLETGGFEVAIHIPYERS
jgi:signal transduction histidine kinase